MKTKILSIAGFAVFSTLLAFGADGTWNAMSHGNWNDTTKWLNGIIANGDDSSAVMLTGYSVALNQAVSLNHLAIKATGFTLNNSSENVFTMKNNPLIEVDPFPSRGLAINLNQMITGDGSVLTIKGGNINLEPYSGITNFSCVDLKGVASLSPRYSRPVTDGDLRMSDSRINNNSQELAGFLVAGGKLIIGPGQNVFRAGYTNEMTLPAVIEREAQGTLQVTLDPPRRMFLADPQSLTNAEGRLPTWMFTANSGSYRFSTHTVTDGIVAFPFTKFDLAIATDADTVRVANPVTLAADAAAGALYVTSTLSFPGQTLTLGAPGMLGTLLLETSIHDTLGTLTFTGSEGLIVVNNSVAVAPQITGPMALSVQAGMDNINATINNTLLLNNAANDFSGGLHILVGTVSSTNDPTAFGPGPIYVRGQVGTYTELTPNDRIAFGGQLYLQKGTLTNPLYLEGAGSAYALAALRLGPGSKVASSITLTDAVAIRSDAGRAEISGSISGDYSLRLWPDVAGQLVISGANSYTGGTMIVAPVMAGTVPGIVQLAATGSFGSGPIQNNGTLMLDISHSSFDAPLTGSGTFLQTNNTTVTFQNTVSQGTLFVDKGTVAVNGVTNSFGALVGQSGSIQAATDTVVVLGANSAGTGIFYGEIADGAGKISLVKRGTNTQVLAGSSTYTGETIVEGGTLRLGGDFSTEALPTLAIAPTLVLDAANYNATVTTNAFGAVTAWASKGSVAATFAQSDPAMMPVYDSQAMNGLGGIRFSGVKNGDGSAVTNRLSCAAAGGITEQTVYAVSHPATPQTMFAGLIGSTGGDNGIRLGGGAAWDTGFLKWGISGLGNFAVNGVERTAGFSYATPHLLRTVVDGPQSIGSALSVGQYFDNSGNYPRAFNGSIGEILMYPRRLTPAEDSLITSYLMNKWRVGGYVAPSQILPASTAMTVRKGAILDFNGTSQTFASLVSAGTLRNSSTNLVTITFSSGNISGPVEGPINFVKVGSGALEISQPENASFSGKMIVTDGSVTLKSWFSEQLPDVSGLTFHLDAARIENLVTNGQNEVVTWKNSGVAGGDFVRDTYAPVTTPPTFSAAAFGGRKGVQFNGTEQTVTNRLRNTANTIGRTFFFVTQTDGYSSNAGIFGPINFDYGIRLGNSTSWAPYRSGPTDDGFGFNTNYFINGIQDTRSFQAGVPYLFTVRANRDNWSRQWALGNYVTVTPQARAYNGLMGEVVAYSRFLTPIEQQSIEAYLASKWMGVKTADNNILSSDTTLELGPTGTLDLGQMPQTFSGLSGSGGSVTNGNATLTGTLEVTVDDGVVTPFFFSSLILSDGLNIVFKNGIPANGSVILEGGAITGDPATFTLPPGFSASLSDNKLAVFRSGTLMIVR